MTETRTFTLVFEGDVCAIKKNFFRERSEFGKCIAAGVGNAFDDVREECAQTVEHWAEKNCLDLSALAKEIREG